MKLFLDTNIILDFLGKREHYEAAANILQMGIEKSVVLYITDLTIANAIYTLRKDIGKDNAKEGMRKLCSFLEISPLTQKETNLAFSTDNPDFEDAMQYFSAMSVGCDCIITRDLRHFRYSKIPVMSAEDFLQKFL